MEDKDRNENKGYKQRALTDTKTTNSYLSVIIQNITGLKATIKRQRLSKWIKKQNLTIYYLQEIHFKYNDKYKFKKYHADINQKKSGVALLTLDQADIKVRKLSGINRSTMIKKLIFQEDRPIFNVYISNNGVSNVMR